MGIFCVGRLVNLLTNLRSCTLGTADPFHERSFTSLETAAGEKMMMTEFRDIWLHANNMICSARQIINENLKPLNLSSAEGNILLHLLAQGDEMVQEQLVEQLDISKPAVSRALDSLEKKEYVIRQQDPSDRRAHRVRLKSSLMGWRKINTMSWLARTRR